MTWVHVDTRYGRKYSCELQITGEALVYNHRSYPTVEVEYIQLDPEDETRLNVKFVGRNRPKAFFFISSDACEEAAASIVKVCEAAHKRTKQQAEEAVSFRVHHTSLSEAVTGEPAPTDVFAGPPPVTSGHSLGAASIPDTGSASHMDHALQQDRASHDASHPDAISHPDTISHPDMADVASQQADDEHLHEHPHTGHSPDMHHDEALARGSPVDIGPEGGASGARPPREALLREVPHGQIPGSIPAKLLSGKSRGASRAASITPSRGEAHISQPSLSRNTSFHVPHPSPVMSMLRSTTHTFHFRQRGKATSSRSGAHTVSPNAKRLSRIPARGSAGLDVNTSATRRADEEAGQGTLRRGIRDGGGLVSFGGLSDSDDGEDHPQGVIQHCLREHPLEIFMFFTLMPLVFAGFWLSDAGRDVLERRGSWIRASCTVHAPVTLVAEAMHHGHHAPHTGEEELTKGMVFVLERGWNVTVEAPPTRHAIAAATRAATPLDAVSDADGHLDGRAAAAAAAAARSAIYADRWLATAVEGLEPNEEEECRGHMAESLAELRERCAEDWTEAPVLPLGQVRPCYAHRVGDSAVFLDVSEPWSFYADLGVGVLCLVVSVLSLLAVVRAQRRMSRGEEKGRDGSGSNSRAVLV